MKYEDLCRDPDRLLSEIYRFVGVDPMLGSEDFRGTKQHILGNAMRLNSTGEIRLDEKWKEKLTEAELEIFGRIGGEMNRFLAIPVTPSVFPVWNSILWLHAGAISDSSVP